MTVIPENMWRDQLDLVPLQESDVVLKSYSARDIPVVGDSTSSLLGVGEFISNTFLVAAPNATTCAKFSIVELDRSVKRKCRHPIAD